MNRRNITKTTGAFNGKLTTKLLRQILSKANKKKTFKKKVKKRKMKQHKNTLRNYK